MALTNYVLNQTYNQNIQHITKIWITNECHANANESHTKAKVVSLSQIC